MTDVNERPFNLSLSKICVKENQRKGTLVGTITAQDPDDDVSRSRSKSEFYLFIYFYSRLIFILDVFIPFSI